MHILNETGIDSCEIRLRGNKKNGRRARQGCWLLILFSLQSEYLNKEALEEFGDFKIEGQAIPPHKLRR
jgi:hypothetical protein